MTPARRQWLQGLSILGLGCAGLCSALPQESATPTLVGEAGAPVSWPTIHLLDGQVWTPQSLQNQAMVMVFFSLSCPFCRRHNRRLEVLARTAAASAQPLRVLGVCTDGNPASVRDHWREEGLRFPVSLDAASLRPLFSTRRVVPLTGVTDRLGRVREVIPGEMSEPDVMGLLRWAAEARAA